MGRTRAERLGRSYFTVAGALILALALLGFSDNLATNVGQPSNHDLKFIFHGLFCLAWMIVFAVQANMVRLGNIRLHRRLGVASMFIAAGVTLSTLFVFIKVWKGWSAMPVYGQANRLLLPCYALFVFFGYLNRRRADRHKRLLYIATLYMLEPILSRAFDPFMFFLDAYPAALVDRAWWIFFLIVWNGFFMSLLAYDRIVEGRFHPISIGGYVLLCAVWAVVRIV